MSEFVQGVCILTLRNYNYGAIIEVRHDPTLIEELNNIITNIHLHNIPKGVVEHSPKTIKTQRVVFFIKVEDFTFDFLHGRGNIEQRVHLTIQQERDNVSQV